MPAWEAERTWEAGRPWEAEPAWEHEPAWEADLVIGEVRLDVSGYLVHVRGRPIPLSPRELQLLRALMLHAGRVQTFRSLYQLVWGQENPEDYRSLKTHVLRLRRKIESDPHTPTHIRTVRGVGYVFDRIPTLPAEREVPDAAGTPPSVPHRS